MADIPFEMQNKGSITPNRALGIYAYIILNKFHKLLVAEYLLVAFAIA